MGVPVTLPRPRVRAGALAAAAVAAVGVGYAALHATGPVEWTPDALYYQAQALELRGVDATAARRLVFDGPLGADVRRSDPRYSSHSSVDYQARFYRRRWLAPALAAALMPLAGARSLQLVSLLGYALAGLAVFALVRRRHGPWLSASVAILLLLLAPMREWAPYPLTDCLGVALLAGSLLAATYALERGGAWLVPWAACLLALSVARDATAIPVGAALACAAWSRTRRPLLVALTGVAAALPALLLFPAPLLQTLAYTFNFNEVPKHATWAFVESRYPEFVQTMLHQEFPLWGAGVTTALLAAAAALLLWQPSRRTLVRARPLLVLAALAGAAVQPPATGAAVVVCLALLFLPGPGPYTGLLRAAAVAAAAFLFVLPEFTGFRLALVLLPCAALGLAAGAERFRSSLRLALE